MNYIDLCQSLIAQTSKLLDNSGFTARSGSDHVRFEKKVSYGKQVIYYHIANIGGSYQVSMSLVIFHQIVETVHALALGLNKKSLAIRGTLNLTINEHVSQSLRYFPIGSSADIQKWCLNSTDYINNIGLQELNTYGNIHELDKLFNDRPCESLPGCIYMLSRAEKGIIIAKICRNPKLQELIDYVRISSNISCRVRSRW
jgi:hypothetical protein